MATTNIAFHFNAHGSPAKVLQKVTHVLERPAKDRLIRVRMLAAPINHADLGTIAGRYPMKPSFPNAVPGNEGVGIVEEADLKCQSLAPGDYVIPAVQCLGTWQKYLWAEETKFIKLPFEQSGLEEIVKTHGLAALATLNSNVGTAYRFLNHFVDLKPGDVICQSSANSFLGQMIIQMAKLRGLKSVNLVRDESEKQDLYALGASLCLTYEECKEEVVIRKLSSLPKLALCTVGGPLFQNLASIMAEKSTILVISSINKIPLELSLTDLVFKQFCIKGTWISKWYQEGWEKMFLQNNNDLWNQRIRMLNDILGIYKDKAIAIPPCEYIPFEKLSISSFESKKKLLITF